MARKNVFRPETVVSAPPVDGQLEQCNTDRSRAFSREYVPR